ncbi:MAG: polynucleotide adenylyltransferase PcnB [Gammaproteobacteria bacterium]|nr:polynucleotide adenylyltransferase PcnB [Gammaproteobacteria bacterium]
MTEISASAAGSQTPAPHAPDKALHAKPRIIPRSDHPISRKDISEQALKVLYRLDKAGYQAYLVGGGVRDLLLGRMPKDFDVATDALPEQVRELFRNCRLIGRRFRLAHVHFGRDVIEVATFRASGTEEAEDQDAQRVVESGRIIRDNVYGQLDDDVWRRDFTVNALYYNIRDFSVVDYVGGTEDIAAGRLRLIGDPDTRLREDPVRMLRAVRFAAKLGFEIDPATAAPFAELAPLLGEISPARLFDEALKLFHGGAALATFEALGHYGLLRQLFPQTDATLADPAAEVARRMLPLAMANTDERVAAGKPVNPAFLLAVLLWQPMRTRMQTLIEEGVAAYDAERQAADEVIARQLERVAVPRRFTQISRDIWSMQSRLERPMRRHVQRMASHEKFRAAYDFLLLRAAAGDDVEDAANWWREFEQTDDDGRAALVDRLANKRRAPRRRRRKPAGGSANA